MMSDTITRLLEEVASGKVSIKDARAALEDAELTEPQYLAAVDHGVFNPAEPGTIVNASLAPSGGRIIHGLGPTAVSLSLCNDSNYNYYDGSCLHEVGST